jgi:hypothetical protein
MEPGADADDDDLLARLRATVLSGDGEAQDAALAQLSARAKSGDPAALLAYCRAMAVTFSSTPHVVPAFAEMGVTAVIVAALRGHTADAALQCAGLSALTWLASDCDSCEARAPALAAAALAALEAHPNDAAVQHVGCTALARAALAQAESGSDADACATLVRAPALAAAALLAHAGNEDVVRAACELITTVMAAQREDRGCCAAAAASLAAAGVVTALVAVMKHAPGAAATQVLCCDALCALAVAAKPPTPEVAVAALHAGAPSALVAALRAAGATDAAAAGSLCRLLGLLCTLAPRFATAEADGVDAALATLAAHAGDARVQDQACHALRVLCTQHPVNQARASATVRDLVAALARGEREGPDAQARRLCLLGVLTHNSGANTTLALNAGVVAATLAAMRAHGAHAQLQEHGCTMLGTVAVASATGDTAPLPAAAMATRTAAVAAGAYGAVVAALRSHGAAHARLAHRACSALANVCSASVPNKLAAARAGAIEAVVAAMRAHPGDVLVAQAGSAALQNIPKDIEENQARAVAAGALPALAAALVRHVSDLELVAHASAAFSNTVGESTAASRAAAEAGALEALLAALRTHATSAAAGVALSAAAGAIGNIVDNDAPALPRRAVSLGCVAAMVAAMRAQPASEEVQWSCSSALGKLCGCATSLEVACGAGAVEAVVAALQRFPRAEASQRYFLYGLGTLCRLPANAARAGAAGGVEAVVASFAAHARAHRLVFTLASNTLYLMCCEDAGAVGARHAARGVAAGAVEALASNADAWLAGAPAHEAALLALSALMRRDADTEERAACAGVLSGALLAPRPPAAPPHTPRAAELARRLAAQLAAATTRCGEARESGAMCALDGCWRRSRAADAAKRLRRCGACRCVAYCDAAHQREDWKRHKAQCAATQAAAAAPAGGQ